jgi:hypothetical protein
MVTILAIVSILEFRVRGRASLEPSCGDSVPGLSFHR